MEDRSSSGMSDNCKAMSRQKVVFWNTSWPTCINTCNSLTLRVEHICKVFWVYISSRYVEMISLHISRGVALFVGQPAMLTRLPPCCFLFSLGNRGGHTHMASKAKLETPKNIPRKETQQKQPTTQKRKRKKENPEKEPLTFVRGLKKLVARKGQVEGNEPEVSRGPSNTGS